MGSFLQPVFNVRIHYISDTGFAGILKVYIRFGIMDSDIPDLEWEGLNISGNAGFSNLGSLFVQYL
jgi:hypothetical protein